MTEQTLAIADATERNRYEATADGELAGFAVYELEGPDKNVIAFTHTEVLSAFEGQGIASKLARRALDDARARGLDVLPRCPYIAGWIRKHPEYVDLVPSASRARYDLPTE